MKKFKGFLMVLVVAVLVISTAFALVACNSEADDNNGDENNNGENGDENNNGENGNENQDTNYDAYVLINGENGKKVGMVTLETEDSNITIQYTCALQLNEGDSIAIFDTNGEYVNYEPESKFKGKATVDGSYTVYAKRYADGGNSIYVTVPDNFVEPVTLVYYYNVNSWDTVYAYAWSSADDKNAEWPGEVMTAVEGQDGWYSYAVGTYTNVIFTNGTAQTADLVFNASTPYYNGSEWGSDFTIPDNTEVVDNNVAVISVNGGEPINMVLNEAAQGKVEYMIISLSLNEGDVVAITVNGQARTDYKAECGFDGTVSQSGNYDIYVADDGIWVEPSKA